MLGEGGREVDKENGIAKGFPLLLPQDGGEGETEHPPGF